MTLDMDVYFLEEGNLENVAHAHHVSFGATDYGQPILEFQMTKRRAELASKQASEALSKHPNSPQQDALLVEGRPERALKDALQTMDDHSNGGSVLFTSHTNVLAYQAKLLEFAQANMQFALEVLQRLTTIKSPR